MMASQSSLKDVIWVSCFNVFWFQLYDKVEDSIGVMYLVVMNLPREERFLSRRILSSQESFLVHVSQKGILIPTWDLLSVTYMTCGRGFTG